MKELDLIDVLKSFNFDDFLKFFDKKFSNKYIINLLANDIEINEKINEAFDIYFVKKFNVGLFDDSVLDENGEVIYDTVIDWMLNEYNNILYPDNFVRYVSLKIVDAIMSEPYLTNLRAPLYNLLVSGATAIRNC